MAMPKTGRGISPAMMGNCGSPMKQDLTAQGARSRSRVIAGEKKRMESKNDNIVIDPKTGVAAPKPYGKKFLGGEAESSNKKVPTDPKRSNAMVVDSSGKKVKEAKKGQGKRSNEELYKEYQRDSTNTMSANKKAARFYNVQSGRAQASNNELAEGQNRGFFARNQG
jgi:hypothetical protein